MVRGGPDGHRHEIIATLKLRPRRSDLPPPADSTAAEEQGREPAEPIDMRLAAVATTLSSHASSVAELEELWKRLKVTAEARGLYGPSASRWRPAATSPACSNQNTECSARSDNPTPAADMLQQRDQTA